MESGAVLNWNLEPPYFPILKYKIKKEISLSFSADAKTYIVSGELIPESNKLYKGRMSGIGNMLGFTIGIFATKI